MSGPLVDWVTAHTKAHHYGRCFLASAALRANHVGEGADLSIEQVAKQWGISETSAHDGRREVLALGELVRISQGGGRGRVPRYRIPVAYCPAEAGCWECKVLKGCATRTLSQRPKRRKGAPRGVKGAPHAPPTVTEKKKGGASSATTTPGTGRSPTPPAPSADDYLAAFTAWMRAEHNPDYTLNGEIERELREHLADFIARGLTEGSIAAGLKSWATDPKGPGPIALPRHVDKAQRDPAANLAYRLRDMPEPEDTAARSTWIAQALKEAGAEELGNGQWAAPEGGVLPNEQRATAWLAARGVMFDPDTDP